MSNLIKSRYVLKEDNKKFIDSNELSEKYRVIQFEQVKVVEEISTTREEFEESSFVQGLKISQIETVGDKLSAELSKELQEEAINKARAEAESIINNARIEAEELSRSLYEEAKEKAYLDGISKANDEIQAEKASLEQLKFELMKEYEDSISNLEGRFADLVTRYVEKLTGICVSDTKDVISYLIHNSFMAMDPTKSLYIRVSREDYELVYSKIEEYQSYLGVDTSIEVKMDHELVKNQCCIETDTSIIDCSLDVKLNNLAYSIKLIASQSGDKI